LRAFYSQLKNLKHESSGTTDQTFFLPLPLGLTGIVLPVT